MPTSDAARQPQTEPRKRLEKVLEIGLILLLIVLTVCMMLKVRNIQGNARVVNYAGILRGATQREMKLEIAGQENDEMIEYLDDIFDGLMHGGGKYNLTRLNEFGVPFFGSNIFRSNAEMLRNDFYNQFRCDFLGFVRIYNVF